MGPRKQSSDPPRGRSILGVVRPIEKHWESAAVYAATVEPIEMPFAGLTHVGRTYDTCRPITYIGVRSDESIRRREGSQDGDLA